MINTTLSMDDGQVIEKLETLKRQITYSLLIFFLLIGNIGCVFNTIIFLRPCLITSSCSRYFLAASFANLFQLDIGLVSHILDSGFDIHPHHSSTIICKLRNYLINTGGFLSQNYLLLACIDRYLISRKSSLSIKINRISLANRVILFSTCFWLIFLSHMLVYSEILIEKQFCFFSNSFYVIFISSHNLILSGFLLPFLMVIFGLLTWKNIRRIRQQTRQNRRRTRRNHYLSLMLISNVLVNVFFTLMYTAGLASLSVFFNNNSQTFSHRNKVEQTFVSFIAIIFYYAPFTIFFYINVLTSQRFRLELKNIFFHQRSIRQNFFNKVPQLI